MKKLTILASALLIATACSEQKQDDEHVGSSLEEQPKIIKEKKETVKTEEQAPAKDSKEVVKKFDWSWEPPKEAYYTLGMNPMEDGGLYQRFGIERDNMDYTVLRVGQHTVLYAKTSDGYRYYSHTQLENDGVLANDKQASVLAIPETFASSKESGCVALTGGMVDAFDEDSLLQTLTYLQKTSEDSDIQTWVFLDEDDGGYYFSQRDINKPTGFTYRCKPNVIESMKTGLSIATKVSF